MTISKNMNHLSEKGELQFKNTSKLLYIDSNEFVRKY